MEKANLGILADVSQSVSSTTSSCGDEENYNNNSVDTTTTTTGANDKLISNVLSCMKLVSPDDKFDTKKSKKMKQKKRKIREKKELHPNLLTVWHHADELFSNPDVRCVEVPSPYPQVDWSLVNKRMIANIPDPTPQPVHGVHQDPAFYESKEVLKPHVPGTYPKRHTMSVPSKFREQNPFGTLPGYLTDAGVVHPDSNPQQVHGYVWSPSCQQYILHAEFMTEDKQKKVYNFKKKLKKK